MKKIVLAKTHKTIIGVFFIAGLMLLNGIFLYNLYSSSFTVLAFTLLTIALVVAFLTLRHYSEQEKKVERSFLAALLSLGLLYSAVFPAATIPDELYHFETSVMYSNALTLKPVSSDSIIVRSEDAAMLERTDMGISYESYKDIAENFSLFCTDPQEIEIETSRSMSIESSLPQLKLPSAIGITLASLCNLGSYPLFYIGRLFNFLFFVALVLASIRITPVAKTGMMAICLLPMTIHITSSYSWDAGIIGLAFLLTALLLKAIYTPEAVSRKHLISIGIVSILLAPCKMVYSLIGLLVFLIPKSVFKNKKQEILYKIIVILVPLITMILIRVPSLLYISGASGALSSTQGIEGPKYHTLSEFFSDPFGTFMIFLNTIDQMTDFLMASTVGQSLGTFDPKIWAPWHLGFLFITLLFISFLKTMEDKITAPLLHKLLFIAIIIGGAVAIAIPLFLSWTPYDENFIYGLQGRYILPFLPLFALIVRNKTIITTRNLSSGLIFIFFVCNLAYLVRIYALAIA